MRSGPLTAAGGPQTGQQGAKQCPTIMRAPLRTFALACGEEKATEVQLLEEAAAEHTASSCCAWEGGLLPSPATRLRPKSPRM